MSSRRKFIHDAGCAAIGGSTLISSILNLNLINVAAGYNNTEDYKALVCILLAGGNDSFNMLIPKGTSEYAEYGNVRGNLAIPSNEILPLNNGINNGRELGLHPSFNEIKNLYNNSNAAFIANVGSLVEPVTLSDIENNSKKLPLGLFSHVDQISHWQTSIPQERGQQGWGGRMGEILSELNTSEYISMNISLSGSNLFQTGSTQRPFTLTANGSIGINGYGGQTLLDSIKTSALDSLMGVQYQNLFDITYNKILRNSNNANQLYDQAINKINPIVSPFSQNNLLSRQLEVVAKTIAASTELGMSRQIFFVNFGGWDHHDEVLDTQANMLGILDTALSEFYNATVELNVENKVTSFSISDFGRTLTSNGNGSDHAWGGNALVLGGAVNGGNIYGMYPDLYLGNPQDLGRGRLIPTLSADEYFAELALWFGVSTADLDMVFPNIHAFYDVISGNPPIGFLLS